jgi:hypothetical protein
VISWARFGFPARRVRAGAATAANKQIDPGMRDPLETAGWQFPDVPPDVALSIRRSARRAEGRE